MVKQGLMIEIIASLVHKCCYLKPLLVTGIGSRIIYRRAMVIF